MLKFKKIENGTIFTKDFNPFTKNNEIEFAFYEEIAVIYGLNGAGKTSLVKVLSVEKGTKLEIEYNYHTYEEGKDIFHIINDQNNRNIIAGETKDFLLGDNIKREFELQELIKISRRSLIDSINAKLKTRGITAQSSPLIELITDKQICKIIKEIANNKSKGDKFPNEDLINKLNTIPTIRITEYDESKLLFVQNDFGNKDSLIKKIIEVNESVINSSPSIHQIEENTEAINILSRFKKNQCIVCDTKGIDWKKLLESKINNKKIIIEALSEDVKSIIEKIITLVPTADPFKIKVRLLDAISKGDNSEINILLDEINSYKELYSTLVLKDIKTAFSASELPTQFAEYQALIDAKPELTEEDELYIQEIISSSMNKSLTLKRDFNKNLKILLDDKEVLGKRRDELPLSTGEQNFLSLTFEFLKAKNSTCPVIVIDDPISSFDSIYKNKIVYAFVKMLHYKKRIVLTHNTDLLRLLESQYNNCYKLYILNNTDGEENGFIPINNREQEILISLDKLLRTFREDIFNYIQNVELFLISIIPFMRGCASIIGNKTEFNKLTELMHGYKTGDVDIAEVYRNLFGDENGELPVNDIIPKNYIISVPEILKKTVSGVHILNPQQYPLLNKTLLHSFTYLFLRLMVEKTLVAKFNINTNIDKKLGQIISRAFPDDNDIAQIRNRIRLTSKKTLINEFNHFEGNLSIFQPAIDITDHALESERKDIETFVRNL